MFRLLLALALCTVAAGPAPGQTPFMPAPPSYATNPGSPLIPQASSPVQQQILENYRSQLQQTQRDMLQQNPSGNSSAQFEINRQLNSYNMASPPSYGTPPTSAAVSPPPQPRVPPRTTYVAPSRPYDRMPVLDQPLPRQPAVQTPSHLRRRPVVRGDERAPPQ